MSLRHMIATRPALRRTTGRQRAFSVLLLAGLLLAGCVRGPAGPIEQPVTASGTPPSPEAPPSQANETNPATPQPPADISPEPPPQATPTHAPGKTGLASYYGSRFAGRRTASGERFDPSELTAAHRTLPFGTRVRVTNLDNGQQVTVRVNDRGPFVGSRIIDLSHQAAEQIGLISEGVTHVRVQVLE